MFDATAPLDAVASRSKKSASRVHCTRLARFVLRGWLYRDRMVFGASGADNLIGGTENLLGALFGYRFRVKTTPTAEPILNIPATKSGSLKPQRFTTKKRHGFRFDLAQTTRRRLSIREICLGGMAQDHVSEFVQKCLVWQLSERVNCDLTVLRKALHISVRLIERNALDT